MNYRHLVFVICLIALVMGYQTILAEEPAVEATVESSATPVALATPLQSPSPETTASPVSQRYKSKAEVAATYAMKLSVGVSPKPSSFEDLELELDLKVPKGGIEVVYQGSWPEAHVVLEAKGEKWSFEPNQKAKSRIKAMDGGEHLQWKVHLAKLKPDRETVDLEKLIGRTPIHGRVFINKNRSNFPLGFRYSSSPETDFQWPISVGH